MSAVSLWVSIDTPDVDLECDLYEIQPDGTSIALWSDLRRLRYRESLHEAKLVKPGEIVRCDFNPGLFVARRLMKGSRLRLVVTAVNSILWQKNYCSAESSPKKQRRMRTPATCRYITMPSTQARLNCHCASKFAPQLRVKTKLPVILIPQTREKNLGSNLGNFPQTDRT
jgi:predicted acyl esterase